MGGELSVLDVGEVRDGEAGVPGEFGEAARGVPVNDPVPAHGLGVSDAREFVAGVGVAGSPGMQARLCASVTNYRPPGTVRSWPDCLPCDSHSGEGRGIWLWRVWSDSPCALSDSPLTFVPHPVTARVRRGCWRAY